MQKIIRIEHIEEKKDKHGRTYYRTHAILNDGTECIGFGKDFDLDMRVVTFFHYGVIKMKKYKIDN